jgi:hypothetical protein
MACKKNLPQSFLSLEELKKPRYSRIEGGVSIRFKEKVPFAQIKGHRFEITDSPSIIIAKKRMRVIKIF